MRSIKKLWLKYRGKSAVIFANGPSLLKFVEKMDQKNLSSDFYEATWMGINYSFEKFSDGHKNMDYIFLQEYATFNNILKVVPPEKLIIPEYPGLVIHGTPERIRIGDREAYGYTLQDPLKNRRIDLPSKEYGIDKDVKILCYTTTTQSALHICCYMGFTKIYLIGVDYQTYSNGLMHYHSKYDKNYGSQKLNALGRHKEGDLYLIPALERANDVKIINIGKYL